MNFFSFHIIIFLVFFTISGCVSKKETSENRMKFEKNELSILMDDGSWLAGTLEKNDKMKSLAIFVHGGFVQDRDGNLDGRRTWMFPSGVAKRFLFSDIRKHLKKHSIGSYSYDKRGAGSSEGTYLTTDMNRLSRDLFNVVKYLKKNIFSGPIILIGQSEGTLTIPRAIEFGLKPNLVILQGPVVGPIQDVLRFQKKGAALPFLDPQGAPAKKIPLLGAFYKHLEDGTLEKMLFKSKKRIGTLNFYNQKFKLNLDLWRQYGTFNVRNIMGKTSSRIALIVGERDLNTPSGPIREFKMTKEFRSNKRISAFILKGLDHSFREVKPNENFISTMKKPISSKYFDILDEILRKNL